jgi:hypothetical protein
VKKKKLKPECCDKYKLEAKSCKRCPIMAVLSKKRRKKRLKKIKKRLAKAA